jgi:hypothetical protein
MFQSPFGLLLQFQQFARGDRVMFALASGGPDVGDAVFLRIGL